MLHSLSSLPQGFFSGSLVFLPTLKPKLPNFNSVWKQWMKQHLVKLSPFIYFFICIWKVTNGKTRCTFFFRKSFYNLLHIYWMLRTDNNSNFSFFKFFVHLCYFIDFYKYKHTVMCDLITHLPLHME